MVVGTSLRLGNGRKFIGLPLANPQRLMQRISPRVTNSKRKLLCFPEELQDFLPISRLPYIRHECLLRFTDPHSCCTAKPTMSYHIVLIAPAMKPYWGQICTPHMFSRRKLPFGPW